MLCLNRIQILSTCARALSQNSGMKFRHLYSNDLRDWAGGQEDGKKDAENRSTGVARRRAIAMTAGSVCLLVVATQVPSVESNAEKPKPTGSYALNAESWRESEDVTGESDKLVGGTKESACESIGVQTEPSNIEVTNWLELGGVRSGSFIKTCSNKRIAWQITQTLEMGEWKMQKVARLP